MSETTYRTPPPSVNEDDKEEQTTVPTGELGAVTRKQHEIKKLPDNLPDNLESAKSLFAEYVTKVDTLYEACVDTYEEWLAPHKISIEGFRRNFKIYYIRDLYAGMVPV